MPAKDSFAIPRSREQSCKGARDAYYRMWSWDWPHDDNYLRELARESDTCATLLMAMRENDPRPNAPAT